MDKLSALVREARTRRNREIPDVAVAVAAPNDLTTDNDNDEQSSLRNAGNQCRAAIEKASQEALAPLELQWARDRLIDFNHWAAGVGLFTNKKNSLDHRLRLRSDIKAIVISILDMLTIVFQRFLQQPLNVSSTSLDAVSEHGSSSPALSFASWSSESDHDESTLDGSKPLEPLAEVCTDAENLLDRLIDMGNIIRKSGLASRLLRADATFQTELHQPLLDHLELQLRLSNMRSTREATGQLGSALATEAVSSTILRPEQVILIHANLRRRHRFEFARKRAATLALQSEPLPFATVPPLHEPISQDTALETKFNPEPTVISTQFSASAVDSTFNMPSRLSDEVHHGANEEAASSVQTSVTMGKVKYPKAPRMSRQRAFKCPCCSQILPKRIGSSTKTWKKHLCQDLYPYTCPVVDCRSSTTFFIKRKDWKAHLDQNHTTSMVWSCSMCQDESKFYERGTFEQHIRDSHSQSIPSGSYSKFVSTSALKTLDLPRTCPICNQQKTSLGMEAFTDHLADCLHSFSLSALPWNDSPRWWSFGPEPRAQVDEWLSNYVPDDLVPSSVEVGRASNVDSELVNGGYEGPDDNVAPDQYFDDSGTDSTVSDQSARTQADLNLPPPSSAAIGVDRNQTTQLRDLMYCHSCGNEWWRDEHGTICPECQSDSTGKIEYDHGPQEEIGNLAGSGGAFAPEVLEHNDGSQDKAGDHSSKDIEFPERQQNNAKKGGALYIPGPRDFDHGERPEELDQELVNESGDSQAQRNRNTSVAESPSVSLDDRALSRAKLAVAKWKSSLAKSQAQRDADSDTALTDGTLLPLIVTAKLKSWAAEVKARRNAELTAVDADRPRSKPNESRIRTWTDRSGSFVVEAEFLGLKKGKVHLHKVNGVKIGVPVAKMSLNDLEYIEHSDEVRRELNTDSDRAGRVWAREVDDPWWPCILSLDGGGVRAYSSLLILQELMREVRAWERRYEADEDGLDGTTTEEHWRPCHYFDFIYGTSTGGLIAIFLGRLRMTIPEALSAYRLLCEKCFGKRKSRVPLLTKYHHEPLEQAMRDLVRTHCQEHTDCDGNDMHPWNTHDLSEILARPIPFDVRDPRICQSCVLTSIPDSKISEAHALRTYPHYYSENAPNWITRYNEGADTVPIWTAARATTATPFYFEMVQAEVGDRRVSFQDGGIRENNPSGFALSEFHAMYEGITTEPGLLLSIGTGKSDTSADDVAETPGGIRRIPLVGKYLENRAVIQNLLMKVSEGEKQHEQMRQYAHGEHRWYKRLNVSKGLEAMALDHWERGSWTDPENGVTRENRTGTVPGGASLTTMEEATKEYLNRSYDSSIEFHASPRTKLQQTAQKLVLQRRAREQSGGRRWEAFAGYHLPNAPPRKTRGRSLSQDLLQADHDGTDPRGASLTNMEAATEEYLNRSSDSFTDSYASPRTMLQQTAQKLVDQRRARGQSAGRRLEAVAGGTDAAPAKTDNPFM